MKTYQLPNQFLNLIFLQEIIQIQTLKSALIVINHKQIDRTILYMIITKATHTISLIAFRVSNIKPTILEKSLQGLKTTFAPPVSLTRRPDEHTLFRTPAQQTLDKINQSQDKNIQTQSSSISQKQPIDIQTNQTQPTFMSKLNSLFSNPNNTNSLGKTQKQVIDNVHKQTKQRKSKTNDHSITRVHTIPQETSELRILHEKNIGLNLFINRVYITTGCSIMMALGTVYIASSIPYFVMNPFMCIGYGTIMTISGMFAAYYIKPHVVVQEEQGYEHIKTRNGILRTSLFVMGWSGLGLLSMPFANMLASFMPMIVPNLMAMTVGCFGGASIIIGAMPRLPLFTYGGLIGGLVGSVLSMQLMKKFNMMIYGEHFFSNFIQTVDMYGGTLIFSFFIVYNTMKAKQAYQSGNSDHLEISIRFYYDMMKYIQRAFSFIFRRKVD